LVFLFFPLAVAGLGQTAWAAPAQLVEKEQTVEVAPASNGTTWVDAQIGEMLPIHEWLRTGLLSRAAVRLTDLSVARLGELTTMEILPPRQASDKPGLDIKAGVMYFFSREKPQELEIQTPVVTGGLQGTEFCVSVGAGGYTRLAVLDGKVELSNAYGRLLVGSGEEGDVEAGHAPTKTAMIEATNIIQWCLYYPGVIDTDELKFPAGDRGMLADSLGAYRAGDLLGALKLYPNGRAGSSEAARIYHAALLLSVGQVEKARAEMARIPPGSAGRQALEQMIAAVKFQEYTPGHAPESAGDWIAQSYYQQSRGDLAGALKSAQAATARDPQFGFAWARVAELQFSFGRTREAEQALETGLRLSPRNAQAAALEGFLYSANNEIGKAREAFDSAIGMDGALANAWLGRGLCDIRQGKPTLGLQELQVAATLEPNRSVLRSYLGKGLSNTGNGTKARQEFVRAEAIDPNDPTPWLYSALQNKMDNHINQAVADLEHSIQLNSNRRVYRSQFLLDQDQAVRSANLASIYQADGMDEVAVREASRAVEDDYTNPSAHLFLANSYDNLRDPTRISLRYETPWYNELLLAFLLSPVGGGPLSQYVSEQEYSKLFEADGLGLSTATDYLSNGILNEVASQYGTFDDVSYSLDTQYLYEHGIRPNNELSLSESSAQFKFQLGPEDTLFTRVEFVDTRSGDDLQHYYNQTFVPGGQDTYLPDLHMTETQSPGVALLGFHHQWAPGVDTLLLLGRLADHISLTNPTNEEFIVSPEDTMFGGGGAALTPDQILAPSPFNLSYRSDFQIYTAELQQIFEQPGNTFLAGARYQAGEFETSDLFISNEPTQPLFNPAANQEYNDPFERISLYAYDFFRPARWISVTVGGSYDYMLYPENYRDIPIASNDTSISRFSPKAGVTLTPFSGTLIRGAYTKSVGGTSYDESVLLEPTVIEGFPQVYRTLIPETLYGSVAAPRYENDGLSFQQKLFTGTYLGVDLTKSTEEVRREQGIFLAEPSTVSSPLEPFVYPSGTYEHLSYRENTLVGNLNQLIGQDWSVGVRWRLSNAGIADDFPDVPPTTTLGFLQSSKKKALLDQLQLFALYNHPSGFFARAEAVWTNQESWGYYGDVDGALIPTEQPSDFWQFNTFAGYRFRNNLGEISLGLLDINNQNYQLNPLNALYTPIDFYDTIATKRTLLVRVRFNF